jgi:predicted secreted Zn-dependent protease
VLGQAFWSAIHEHEKTHAEIIEELISAGAKIDEGTLEWWDQQDVPSAEAQDRVANALHRALGK